MKTESTEFIFIRHAESTANASSHDPSHQAADPSLTLRGHEQTASMTERIRHLDVRAIYTSDTQRARATAKPIQEAFGLQLVELSEIDEWNLGQGTEVNGQKLQTMFERWCSGNWGANLEDAPNSETLDDLIARVVPAFQLIFDQHEKDGGAVIIVAHNGSISWTMPAFATNISLSYAMQNDLENCCSVSVVSRHGRPHVARWGSEKIGEGHPR